MEMLVAMAIFVAFIGIVINSYAVIVRSQREANEYREMYANAREVFDTVVLELREGMVDYNYYDGGVVGRQDSVVLVAKDGASRTYLTFNDAEGVLKMRKVGFDGLNELGVISDAELGEGMIEGFAFYVSPALDPYDSDSFSIDSVQFQPKVTIYGEFFKELSGAREPFMMDLQTTVSSRVYNQIYQKRVI